MTARLTFVQVLSPLHAGTGQGAGVIDLPIAREKATGIPFLPGSSLKGALRTRCYIGGDTQKCTAIFGPETLNEDDNAASLAQFSDQRLLLLPIRSMAGTFAWVTSPYILRRLLRDIQDTGMEAPKVDTLEISSVTYCCVSEACEITLSDESAKEATDYVYLEDLDLQAQPMQQISLWGTWLSKHIFADNPDWQDMLQKRLCLVHDDVFNFLIETATEITARIRLKPDSKTVVEGGLWYEEALPTETILSGIVLATPVKTVKMQPAEIFEHLEQLTGTTLQLGGKATVGRGMCRVQLAKREG